jgi:putative ABC transport system permease protein
VKAIHRKLFRDLSRLRGQALAVGLVMACGVATFVMSLSMLESLTGAMDNYYEKNRFAHLFAQVKRAPVPMAERLGEIPGVAHVETRIVERVQLDIPGMRAPASGSIVSLPDEPADGLNLLYLRAGRLPEGRTSREVVVSQRFAAAHGLDPGAGVEAVLNGRLETLRVVGIALSPEYIYLIAPGSVLPEHDRFGVFWMGRTELQAAFDMEGAFNDVTVRLMPGADEDEIIDRVDELLARYGGLGAYGRDDQPSHKFVANEINELRATTMIVPTIFLGVAAFLLNIVISRMIAMQRPQIATLKAIGYRPVEVALHFFGFVLIITLLAVVVGIGIGIWMGRGLTRLYIEFFDFPAFEYLLPPGVVVLAFLISLTAAALGVGRSLRAAMRLPPAEAMRPEAPHSFKPTVLERLGIHRILPNAVRMTLRDLERAPLRTGISILGIAMATSILVVGRYSEDAIDELMDFQFGRVQRYDVDAVFADGTDISSISTVRGLRGAIAVEPYRMVPISARNGHREERTAIHGLTRADGLHHLLDMRGTPVDLPPDGIVLSRTLGSNLGLGIGDELTVEAMIGRRPTFTVPVRGLIEDFSGLAAYMHLDEINRLMLEPYSIDGVYITTDPTEVDVLYAELHEAPRVIAVNEKAATVASFRQTIARSMGLMRTFLIGFSVIIAFSVVYNSARISLSERSRDLATLRVIGFSRHEVSAIQLGELAIITLLAIPVGLVLGYGLAYATSVATASELIRIPFVVYPSTFAGAAVIVIIASVASGLVVRRRLDRLDLIAVLKARE